MEGHRCGDRSLPAVQVAQAAPRRMQCLRRLQGPPDPCRLTRKPWRPRPLTTPRTVLGVVEVSKEDDLSVAFGVTLKPDLLERALTHRSYAYEHGGLPTNERL